MSTLTIELPPQRTQTEFNLRRWAELLADPELRKIEGRVETDRGSYQFQIGAILDRLMRGGRVVTECPVSTADGVRAADVAWASANRVRELGESIVFSRAPEICVEVLSPDNTAAEMREKAALYFDAGAQEVWLCGLTGNMTFHLEAESVPVRASRLCPEFPDQIQLK